MDPCPSDEALAAYLEGSLARGERASLTAHVDGCDACRAVLAGAALGAPSAPSAAADDRYVLLETLGAGGMGVVEAAYDRELHRKVALKFLLERPGADDGEARRERLRREAQALAKLAHPNVVAVHDVGLLDGEVFVAMEFVEGATLRGWLQAEPRSVARILDVFRQAGEGLAAAHAAGLVHRDFKPENVLVGADGRVRVTDFGLARADAPRGPTDAFAAGPARTGPLGGTPGYMAPEQRRGEPGDARSDVYAFSVSLREAVTRAPSGGSRRMPAWLGRIVERGLAEAPEDRWPSMRALLDALGRGPRVTMGRALALVAAAAFGVTAVVALRAPAPCAPPEHAFDGVWDAPLRAAVERAFRGEPSDGATERLAYVLRALDGYRDAWTRAEVDTCAATRVRGEQSERLLDLRMTCLDDRRRAVARTVAVLASADRDVATRAVEIVGGVPSLARCSQIRSLEEVAPAPESPEARAAVARAKLALDDARALFLAGKLADARARVEPAVAEMDRVGYAPLLGQLLYWRAQIERDLGLDAACRATLGKAAARALEARDDATLAQASTLMGLSLTYRADDAHPWIEQAGAAIQRLGGDEALEGERLLSLGSIELGESRALAREHLLRARELLAKTRGEDFFLVASVDQRLGNAAFDEGDMDEAMRRHARALALRRRLFGTLHAATISSIFNVSEDAIKMGKPREAREALAEIEATTGRSEGVDGAWYALKLGDIARLERDHEAALGHHRHALDLYERASAPEDALTAIALLEVGRDLLALGRAKEAVLPLERAVALQTPHGAAAAADASFELARALSGAGEDARALALMRATREVYARHPDATDPTMLPKVDAWLAEARAAPAARR